VFDGEPVEADGESDFVAIDFAVTDLDGVTLRASHTACEFRAILFERERDRSTRAVGAAICPAQVPVKSAAHAVMALSAVRIATQANMDILTTITLCLPEKT